MVGGSWGCIIFWKIIITANLKGGKTAVKGGKIPPSPPPLENTLRSSFHQTLEETKGCIHISLGVFFGVQKNVLRKVIHLKVNKKRN